MEADVAVVIFHDADVCARSGKVFVDVGRGFGLF